MAQPGGSIAKLRSQACRFGDDAHWFLRHVKSDSSAALVVGGVGTTTRGRERRSVVVAAILFLVSSSSSVLGGLLRNFLLVFTVSTTLECGGRTRAAKKRE